MSHAFNIFMILFWLGIAPGVICYSALRVASLCSREEEQLADRAIAESAQKAKVTR